MLDRCALRFKELKLTACRGKQFFVFDIPNRFDLGALCQRCKVSDQLPESHLRAVLSQFGKNR